MFMQVDASFYEKCCPDLFPYGYGGPGDSQELKMDDFVKHVLERGLDRQFQQSPRFYFTALANRMRRRVGGVCVTAAGPESESRHGDGDGSAAQEAEAEAMQSEMGQAEATAAQRTEEGTAGGNAVGGNTSSATADATPSEPSAPSAAAVDEVLTALFEASTVDVVDDPRSGRGRPMFHGFEKLSAEAQKLLRRLVPYSASLPGSPMYKAFWRRRLICAASSHVLNEICTAAWFQTISPDVMLDKRGMSLCAGHSLEPFQARMEKANAWTKHERRDVVLRHPATFVRCYKAKVDAIWDNVFCGHAQPLGEIVDVSHVHEEGLRCMHCHSIAWVKADSISGALTDDADADTVRAAEARVHQVLTAKLLRRREGDVKDLPERHREQVILAEQDGKWRPPDDYFTTSSDTHPAWFDFNTKREDGSVIDFSRDPTTGEAREDDVHSTHRRLQWCFHCHRCRESCYKYSYGTGCRWCRYGFPVEDHREHAEVCRDRDRRSRVRVRILPARNNDHVNNTMSEPLVMWTGRCNSDCQPIFSGVGVCDYVTCYVTKADAPDVDIISNIVARRFLQIEANGDSTQRERMKVVANAVYSATHMGAQMANFILLGGNVCTFTRPEVTANPMQRKHMRSCLPRGRSTDLARGHSLGSQLGKRDAYAALASQQVNLHGSCEVTLFHVLTYYALSERGRREGVPEAPHLQMDDIGAPAGDVPDLFRVGDVVFKRYARARVVRMSPHVPLDNNNERSAYATLLLHAPWTDEDSIVEDGSTAVVSLKDVREQGSLPAYVAAFQTRQRTQQDNLTGDEVVQEDNQNGAVGDDADDLTNEEVDGDGARASAPEFDPSVTREGFEGIAVEDVVIENVSPGRMARAHDFIAMERERHRKNAEKSNKLNDEELTALLQHTRTYIPVADESDAHARLEKLLGEMNDRQRLAYKVVEEHINANEQVFMLLTGGGGTGKSHVIKALVHKARITWGKALGVYGSALVVAPTGNAAFNVRGHTWHSALSKTPSQKPLNLSKTMIERLVDRFMGLRLLILDEVSMVNLEDLAEISYRLGVAMKCPDKPFGGLHVVLAGDLYQLPPVSGTAMYAAVKLREKAITVQGRTLIDTHLNAFVELLENNRGDHTLTAVNEEIRQGVMSLRTQSLLRLRTKPDTATTAGEVHERAVWLAVTNKEVNNGTLSALRCW